MNSITKELRDLKHLPWSRGWYPRPKPRPVFYDRFRRRARIVGSTFLLLILLITALLFDFLSRLDDLPLLSDFGRLTSQLEVGEHDPPLQIRALQDGIATGCGQSILQSDRANNNVSAFLPYGDMTAMSGARASCRNLRNLYYEAWQIDSKTGRIIANEAESHLYPFEEYRVGWNALNRPTGYPVITVPEWSSVQMIEALFLDPGAGGFAAQLSTLPLDQIQDGICLDVSAHKQLSGDAIAVALKALSSALAPQQMSTCLIAGVNMPALANSDVLRESNHVVAKVGLVDLTAGGPASTIDAMQEALARVKRNLSGDKLQIALVTNGVAVAGGQRRGRPVSYTEAMFLARQYDANVSFAAESGLHLMRYVDEGGIFHQVWYPNAEALRALVQGGADSDEPVVFWPVGYEDPMLWAIQDPVKSHPVGGDVVSEIASYSVFNGDGPFSTSVSAATTGMRSIEIEDGRVVSAVTESLPEANHIRYFGAALESNTLSLSFRGLARDAEMDQLIALLDELDIPAMFFLSFKDQLDARDLITLLLEKGHQVGVQLIPQRSQSSLSHWAADLRNKLLQHFLAYQYELRARFVLDSGTLPDITASRSLLTQVQALQRSGYIVVHPTLSTTIASETAGPLVDLIYEHALERSTNVITFDIADLSRDLVEGDLKILLAQLKADGFSFNSLPELAEIPPDEAVPPSAIDRLLRDDVLYSMMAFSWASIQGAILILALMVALRSPAYLLLALCRRRRFPLDMDFHPPLTLIIPAYNEEKVIRRTLESALKVDYPDLKIIVVDDGSTDGTEAIVQDITSKNSSVRLIVQENEGKWSALDHAIAVSETPFVAILDADSLIDPMALREIVQPFKNENVGGVSGTVEIGNKDGLLTLFQRLEYLHTQQVMRRAYEVFDGIIVVPGAMGAWRVEAVRAAGLVSGDTITEDADLTIAVHRSGYSVRYQENAKSYTEAPTTISSFRNQRFRWTFGMFQASWKHKRAILERKTVGFISLVDAIWYQLITSMIFPFFDIYFIILVSRLAFNFTTQGNAGDVALFTQTSAVYLLIIALELLNILAAMFFAKRFELTLLIAGPLSRFGYRQLLYLASIQAIYAAITGKLAAWNKLERTGTARLEDKPVVKKATLEVTT